MVDRGSHASPFGLGTVISDRAFRRWLALVGAIGRDARRARAFKSGRMGEEQAHSNRTAPPPIGAGWAGSRSPEGIWFVSCAYL